MTVFFQEMQLKTVWSTLTGENFDNYIHTWFEYKMNENFHIVKFHPSFKCTPRLLTVRIPVSFFQFLVQFNVIVQLFCGKNTFETRELTCRNVCQQKNLSDLFILARRHKTIDGHMALLKRIELTFV